jgi:hypothetical protein
VADLVLARQKQRPDCQCKIAQPQPIPLLKLDEEVYAHQESYNGWHPMHRNELIAP